jgi:NAD(P)-dependent dehydrogenase (short-subunit alcohol dehydrogenase family)
MANQLRGFEGKVAIVTGAGSGIGEAVARELAARGGCVVVADVNQAAAEGVAGALSAEGGTAKAITTDVANPAAVEAMVQFAVESFGGLDVAINNAGIGGPLAPTGEYPLDAWRKVIDINLNGVFYGMRYEIPAMLARGGGAIVNVASILGAVGTTNSPAYVTPKHGMVGLTKAAALEYATRNIRVNSVGQGYIETPLLTSVLDDAALRTIAALHPVGRLGTSKEVAALVAFLASDQAPFITGSYHLIEGGYTAQQQSWME